MKVRFVKPVAEKKIVIFIQDAGQHYHRAEREVSDEEYCNFDSFNDMDVICDHCGQAFRVIRPSSYSVKTIWNTEDGKLHPGDMYWSPGSVWEQDCKLRSFHWDNETDPRGHLCVRLPNGDFWDIDSRANNCTMKEDRTHRCWVREGEPPNITAGKNGHTCSAGAGSILSGNYHGFLRNGEFVSC